MPTSKKGKRKENKRKRVAAPFCKISFPFALRFWQGGAHRQGELYPGTRARPAVLCERKRAGLGTAIILHQLEETSPFYTPPDLVLFSGRCVRSYEMSGTKESFAFAFALSFLGVMKRSLTSAMARTGHFCSCYLFIFLFFIFFFHPFLSFFFFRFSALSLLLPSRLYPGATIPQGQKKKKKIASLGVRSSEPLVQWSRKHRLSKKPRFQAHVHRRRHA